MSTIKSLREFIEIDPALRASVTVCGCCGDRVPEFAWYMERGFLSLCESCTMSVARGLLLDLVMADRATIDGIAAEMQSRLRRVSKARSPNIEGAELVDLMKAVRNPGNGINGRTRGRRRSR